MLDCYENIFSFKLEKLINFSKWPLPFYLSWFQINDFLMIQTCSCSRSKPLQVRKNTLFEVGTTKFMIKILFINIGKHFFRQKSLKQILLDCGTPLQILSWFSQKAIHLHQSWSGRNIQLHIFKFKCWVQTSLYQVTLFSWYYLSVQKRLLVKSSC